MTASAAISERRPGRLVFRWVLGLGAVVFGVMAVLSGGNVLFGGATARAQAGNVVDFVLIINFGAGFVYIATGVTAALGKRALHLARVLAAVTLLVFAALGVYIAMGGAFETRTVAAMTLRSAFWVAQTIALAVIFRNQAGSLANPK
ncbi:MAG: hypothetical protein IPK13_10420 [Deltaproteobacteria bacterium]|nr:hypothetical protein [Deltaproteobacteria bacterium]